MLEENSKLHPGPRELLWQQMALSPASGLRGRYLTEEHGETHGSVADCQCGPSGTDTGATSQFIKRPNSPAVTERQTNGAL
ncbi:hypothetical protein AAFF_G00104280 [Aldrovandia affinis]|uniref:Uncharacterized protein n=1 Tax=Aldrovandia affinis TaxID=143900 RepID=A0AAD7T1W0_9TELE|nr:hypothetical protein AAFF_G00104280 [Aldrovandia affinis]